MEGPRQSRAASRYATSPSPPMFHGPVRKWKKQWVSSSSSNQSNGSTGNDTAPLLLCRWTPLSAADEPPRRRFRYTPIVPIERGNTKTMDNEARASISNQLDEIADMRNDSYPLAEKPSTSDFSKEEVQEAGEDQAD